MSKRQFIRTLLTLVAAGLGSVSFAQEFPPKKSITMVVGFAAGGAADTGARIIAKKLGENIGATVVVDGTVDVPSAGFCSSDKRDWPKSHNRGSKSESISTLAGFRSQCRTPRP